MLEENIGKFGKSMANRQGLLHQIYKMFDIRILFGGHSLNFLPQIIATV